jgi:thymidylate synthase (FAD)
MRLNHGSPLEHGTVYLHLNIPRETNVKWGKEDLYKIFLKSFFNNNPYSRVVEKGNDYYITTNLRVIFENKIEDKTILDIVKEHPEMFCETPTEYHEKRISVYFECDRPTGESFLRHRKGSFARESTRYCNYSNEQKFGGELKIALPSHIESEAYKIEQLNNDNDIPSLFNEAYSCNSENPLIVWLFANKVAEWSYMRLTELGWKAEQARCVLPFDVYSPLCMTMFESDWSHFFDLRALNKTGLAHPDAQALAKPLMETFTKLGYYGMGNESV